MPTTRGGSSSSKDAAKAQPDPKKKLEFHSPIQTDSESKQTDDTLAGKKRTVSEHNRAATQAPPSATATTFSQPPAKQPRIDSSEPSVQVVGQMSMAELAPSTGKFARTFVALPPSAMASPTAAPQAQSQHSVGANVSRKRTKLLELPILDSTDAAAIVRWLAAVQDKLRRMAAEELRQLQLGVFIDDRIVGTLMALAQMADSSSSSSSSSSTSDNQPADLLNVSIPEVITIVQKALSKRLPYGDYRHNFALAEATTTGSGQLSLPWKDVDIALADTQRVRHHIKRLQACYMNEANDDVDLCNTLLEKWDEDLRGKLTTAMKTYGHTQVWTEQPQRDTALNKALRVLDVIARIVVEPASTHFLLNVGSTTTASSSRGHSHPASSSPPASFPSSSANGRQQCNYCWRTRNKQYRHLEADCEFKKADQQRQIQQLQQQLRYGDSGSSTNYNYNAGRGAPVHQQRGYASSSSYGGGGNSYPPRQQSSSSSYGGGGNSYPPRPQSNGRGGTPAQRGSFTPRGGRGGGFSSPSPPPSRQQHPHQQSRSPPSRR